MFDNYPQLGGSAKECRPDYEEAAARLKKTLDADKQFLNAVAVFSEFGSFRSLSNSERTPIYALFGALSLRVPCLDREYEELLKKIEKKS